MKILCLFALVSALLAVPTLAVSKQVDSQAIAVKKDLSPGVRLITINGEPQRFSKAIALTSGTHTFEFNYAFDFSHDQSGRWVSKFTFECSFDTAGTYTLRSKDQRVPVQTPMIWIESADSAAPKCKWVGA